MVGVIQENRAEEFCLVEVKSAFYPGDKLEILPYEGQAETFEVDFLVDVMGKPIKKSNPGTLVKIPYVASGRQYNLIRRRLNP